MTMMILIAVLDAFLQPWGDTAREIKLMNSVKTFGEWCENKIWGRSDISVLLFFYLQ